MSTEEAIEVGRQAIWVLILVSSPIMLIGLFVGLIIALFQALTSIQEMTLTFVPKIIAIFVTMMIFLPFMLGQLDDFTTQLFDRIVGLGM